MVLVKEEKQEQLEPNVTKVSFPLSPSRPLGTPALPPPIPPAPARPPARQHAQSGAIAAT